MTNDIAEMFVVEWSPRQRSYHFETVGEMLENNLRATINGNQTAIFQYTLREAVKKLAEFVI